MEISDDTVIQAIMETRSDVAVIKDNIKDIKACHESDFGNHERRIKKLERTRLRWNWTKIGGSAGGGLTFGALVVWVLDKLGWKL